MSTVGRAVGTREGVAVGTEVGSGANAFASWFAGSFDPVGLASSRDEDASSRPVTSVSVFTVIPADRMIGENAGEMVVTSLKATTEPNRDTAAMPSATLTNRLR
ncbi:MAG TPA: hypothetical protein DCP73_09130 [Chloroflexi bacterium]|nr:hypothetical protein [Chloroflexota bacterium]